MKPTVQAKEWSELNKFLEDMNPEAAKEMGRVDVTIIALKSFISSTLAETRKETLKEIEGIIGKDDDSNGKEGSAIWAGARNNLRHDILSVLKKKGGI